MTIQSKNDIKGTPNGDDHDAQFDPRPKWPFWIGTGGRFPSESVAAFIGMRTSHRGTELRDLDNQADPHLPFLASVRLLSNIQEKSRKVTPYPKLAKLSANILEPTIKRFHNRETRKGVAKAMSDAAESGRLLDVLGVIDNIDLLNNDEIHFRDAMNEFTYTSRRLAQLEMENQNRPSIARELGAQVSSFVSGVMTTIALVGIFVVAFLF